MASTFRKKQKRRLIAIIVGCVLVAGLIALFVTLAALHAGSVYKSFTEPAFADAMKEAYGYSSHYDLKQEDLDAVEGLVYFCQIGMDSSSGSYAPYAYPVVLLCDKTYTDLLIEQSDPAYEKTEDDTDYSDHYKVVNYALSDPDDLNKFRNLRVLRAFDIAELNSMYQNASTTVLYQYYGMAQDSVDFTQVLSALKLNKLTSLKQLSGLTKLEQLSLDYSGITSLEGIEQFPNLERLDLSNTYITNLEGLSKVSGLTYLGLESMHVTPAAATATESSADQESAAGADESPEEVEEGEEAEETEETEEKTFNTTGLGNDAIQEIGKMTKLRYLDVANNNISDLSGLSALTNVEYLYVGNNPLTTLKGVEAMTKLQVLYGSECLLTDISALSGATKLEAVQVDDNELTSLKGLEKAFEMTTLHAEGNELTDASAVAGMMKLVTLDLSQNKLKSVPNLTALSCVTSVNLSQNELDDASGLSGFDPTAYELDEDETLSVSLNLSKNKLKNLTLKASKLTSLDVSENELEGMKLDGCVELQTLTASKNEDLASIEGLNTLAALTTLTAEECAIESLPSVKGLENLTTVKLDGCELEDLSAFEGNESITTLTVKNAKLLTSLSGLHTLTKLTTADFSNCTGLTDDAVKAAFGEEGSLVFPEDSALKLTLSGCTGITDYAVFDLYGNMSVTHDKTETK